MSSPFELNEHQKCEIENLLNGVVQEHPTDLGLISEALWLEFRHSVDFGDFTFEQTEIEFHNWHQKILQLGDISIDNSLNQAS